MLNVGLQTVVSMNFLVGFDFGRQLCAELYFGFVGNKGLAQLATDSGTAC